MGFGAELGFGGIVRQSHSPPPKVTHRPTAPFALRHLFPLVAAEQAWVAFPQLASGVGLGDGVGVGLGVGVGVAFATHSHSLSAKVVQRPEAPFSAVHFLPRTPGAHARLAGPQAADAAWALGAACG